MKKKRKDRVNFNPIGLFQMNLNYAPIMAFEQALYNLTKSYEKANMDLNNDTWQDNYPNKEICRLYCKNTAQSITEIRKLSGCIYN